MLKYEEVLHGEVKKPGLGPLHTEFDGKGFAYTSMFVTSEIVKWNVETLQVVDRIPTYYSVGHLMRARRPHRETATANMSSPTTRSPRTATCPPAPNSRSPRSCIDISGDKMKLLLDFPTVGEPHYAEAIPASWWSRTR